MTDYTCENGKLSPSAPNGQTYCWCRGEPNSKVGYFYVNGEQYPCDLPSWKCDGDRKCIKAKCDLDAPDCFTGPYECQQNGCTPPLASSKNKQHSMFLGGGGGGYELRRSNYKSMYIILIFCFFLLVVLGLSRRGK